MNIIRIKSFSSLLIAVILASTSAHAVVNLKNGNFYVAYDDLIVDQGSGLKLTRHYNSLSGSRGWFGWGWGTEFETRLFIMPDGMLAVRENGNAHVTLYGKPEPQAVSKAVDRIVQTLRDKGQLKPDQEQTLRQRLQNDALLRLQWAERMNLTGTPPAIGTRMNGEEFESDMDRFAETDDGHLLLQALVTGDKNFTLLNLKHAYIAARNDMCGQLVRTQEGFERGTCSDQRFGDQQSFDLQGRLTGLNIKGDWLRLAYGKGPYPQRIIDEAGKTIEMKWNDKGFVSQISGMSDGKQRVTDYSYDQGGNLIKSDAHTANVYRHQYDNRHNMTAILYSDDKRKSLEYDDQDRVTHITQTNGQQAFFRYEANAQGDSSTTYFVQAGGEPREVRHLRYNSRGQLLFDRDARSTEEYEYHPVHHAVTRYKDSQFDCRYDYTDQGKIKRERCPGQGIDNFLDYDAAGNIVRTTLSVPAAMRDEIDDSHVSLIMDYDSLRRVIRIREEGRKPQLIKSYADDSDQEGEISAKIGLDDQAAKNRFSAVTRLQGNVMRGIGQRVRVNSGFVMVRE